MLNSVPFYKRLLSYIYPVRVAKGSSDQNPVLELLLNSGQWQLATEDAIYSDGAHYRPLVKAFTLLKDQLPAFKQVLVLGAGLGSAVQVLNNMRAYPSITLVDNDPVILDWLKQSLTASEAARIELICKDAETFISATHQKYGLIVVDLFIGREVPDFVRSAAFLRQCRHRLEQGGALVMNYIVNDPNKWKDLQSTFLDIFPEGLIVELEVNRLLIAKA
jgi:spermidine synthase